MNMIKVSSTAFDCRKIIKDVMKMFEFRLMCKSIYSQTIIETDVPHIMVSDEERFKRILHTLIANAVKFTQKGQILIRVKTFQKISEKIYSNQGGDSVSVS
jgi:signal transduction histidine kinase